MRKGILVVALVISISLLLLAGCTKNQTPSGYAAYQGQPQGQQAAVGGGCGVAAPAADTGAAADAASAGAPSA
ncbi:hypothetical protein HYV81_04540 [Candidatus Woesearchaeota archaeon]|nr:hypothetical protein [Candidatus Woesearchaeota archaeon]